MKRFILLFYLLLSFMLISCSKQVKMENYQFYAMDTVISIRFYNVENSQSISKEIEQIYLNYNQVADDFKSNGQNNSCYDLNINRSLKMSDEFIELLSFGLEMKEVTHGYYNPFIGRLSHLWKDALAGGQLVDEETINLELDIMNHTSIQLEGNLVSIQGDGNLDLGGIAKGYATKKVQDYLESIDCHSYLLNAGNSTIALGDKAGDCFKVGLSQATSNDYYKTIVLKNKAIGTSSIKEQQYRIENTIYSHLLDAKTGKPAMKYDSISIIGTDAGLLDAFSTACFSMELDQIEELLSAYGYDFICSKNNELFHQSVGVNAYEEN